MLKRLCIVIGIALILIFVPFTVGLLLIPIVFTNTTFNIFMIYLVGVLLTFLIVLAVMLIIQIIGSLFNYIVNDEV